MPLFSAWSIAMQLFRAIPASRLAEAAIGIGRQSTVRVPSNVPYVVDNLWESLRPKHMPSRRHAIYASPTVELALRNASAALRQGDEYVACRVIVDPDHIRVAHLQVKDAREHSDIRLISQWVSKYGHALAELPMAAKHKLAPLFMPGLRRNELTDLWKADALVAELFTYVTQHSTFWSSASAVAQPTDGELFFELLGATDTYRLEAI